MNTRKTPGCRTDTAGNVIVQESVLGPAARGSVFQIVREELANKNVTARVNKAAGLIHVDCLYFPVEDALCNDGGEEARVHVVMDFSVPGHVLVVAPWVWEVGANPHKQAILDALRPLQDRLGVVRLRYADRHGCVMPHIALPAECIATDPSFLTRVLGDLLTAVHQAHPVIHGLMQSGQVDIDAFTFSVPWCVGAAQSSAEGRERLIRFNKKHRRLLDLFAAKVSSRPNAEPSPLIGILMDNQVVAISPPKDPQSLKKLWDQFDACRTKFVVPVTSQIPNIYRGTVVWSREGKYRGISTGGRRPCSCGADRIFVRWDDGSGTWPCIKALDQIGQNEFKIV